MSSKHLLIVTAIFEAGTGLALAVRPTLPVAMLLGQPLASTAGVIVGRIAGAAMFSLGAACWLARDEGQSRAATGLIAAMLWYNLAAVAILAHGAMVSGLFGVALWPAVLLHAALAAWCTECLRVSWSNH